MLTDQSSSQRETTTKKVVRSTAEKTYRAKIQLMFTILRDSVPTLRAAAVVAGQAPRVEDRFDNDDLTPAWRLNKGAVLSKATEYIKYLEMQNTWLQNENRELRARLECFGSPASSQETFYNHGWMVDPLHDVWLEEPQWLYPDAQQSYAVHEDLLGCTLDSSSSASSTSQAFENVPFGGVLSGAGISLDSCPMYGWENTQL